MSLPTHEPGGMKLVKFSVSPTAAKESAREAFYQAKLEHYLRLAEQPIAGSAWFRHLFVEAQQQLAELGRKSGRPNAAPRAPWNARDFGNAYDLFSGGRAVSESLQLDRALRDAKHGEEPNVAIDSLTGITVTPIDWTPLLKGADPQLDTLARLIPADQHVLFVPSFAAATKLSDEANGHDTVLLEMAETHGEDADVVGRYQRQLGLTLTGLGRIVGPAVIRSLAVTGSDPYFPTGTDVAVLFETDQPAAASRGIVNSVLQLAAAKQPDAKPQNGEYGGSRLSWRVFAGSANLFVCGPIAWRGGSDEFAGPTRPVGQS